MNIEIPTNLSESAAAEIQAIIDREKAAAKIDGKWNIYNAIGGIARELRKCETACPTILHGQNVGKAYAVRALRKAFTEAI